jgi:hypothetical protein
MSVQRKGNKRFFGAPICSFLEQKTRQFHLWLSFSDLPSNAFVCNQASGAILTLKSFTGCKIIVILFTLQST